MLEVWSIKYVHKQNKLYKFYNYKMKFIYRILAFVFAGVLMLIVMTVTYVAYLKVSK